MYALRLLGDAARAPCTLRLEGDSYRNIQCGKEFMTKDVGRLRVGLRLTLLSVWLLFLVLALAWRTVRARSESTSQPTVALSTSPAREATREQVERTCGSCHAYPQPDLFPKDLWPHEVDRGFRFLERGKVPPDTPSFASVVEYYRRRAPEKLPVLERVSVAGECPVQFEKRVYRLDHASLTPAISSVKFAHLSDDRNLDVIACDMLNGRVLRLNPAKPGAKLEVVTEFVPNPAHAEVVDLDRDGIKDLLVANLGCEVPTNKRLGSVVWLRGERDGSFRPFTLVAGLGRVADVQATDFDGDGDLDLIAASFGWLEVGEVIFLENRTTNRDAPVFVPSTIDPRHGAIHVPVADLNGDGRPDFVALISQEHERIVAFLNMGERQFSPQVVYVAPHPAFGSSGIQLVDLDGDGDLDVLMSNGDAMDSQQLRPYHGIQWLENLGTYPFKPHRLTSLYGTQRAVAADLDNDGDMDITAVCFLPGSYYRQLCRELDLDALVVLEQVERGRFVRHSLERVACDHATCDIGDYDGDGKLDLVTGNAFIPFGILPINDRSEADWVTLHRNLGRPGLPQGAGFLE